MPHLLNISIGPVQEFIASARRCQDLWFGSHLLSELAKACACGISAHPLVGEGAVIFPGGLSTQMLTQDSTTSVANKLLVTVASEDRADSDAVAEAGRSALMARLAEIRTDVFNRVKGPLLRDEAVAQIEELVEFQWVSVRYGDDQDYATARSTSERHLAAVKNTKTWGQPTKWAKAGVRKSSLDGIRESVLDEDTMEKARRNPETLYDLYRIRPAERLCGVGLLKRYGSEGDGRDSFHSSGHVAAGPIRSAASKLTGQEQKAVQVAFDQFLEDATRRNPAFEKVSTQRKEHPVFGNYDMGILFESRLEELIPDPSNRIQAQQALGQLLRQLGIGTPNPYFAVLLADGDRMGQAIDSCRTPSQHRMISKALCGFAQAVKGIVEDDNEGSLIYSGGDDVLALVPLHRTLACGDSLRNAFHSALSEFSIDQSRDGASPTLSIGVGISHFLDDMGEALGLARRAEKLAKLERNSLAILWQKRAGGTALEAMGRWDTGFLADLELAIQAQLDDDLSRKLPFELEALSRMLPLSNTQEGFADLLELVKADGARILLRKRKSGGDSLLDEPVGMPLHSRIKRVKSPEDLRQLSAELQLAKEFARAYDQAGVKEVAR